MKVRNKIAIKKDTFVLTKHQQNEKNNSIFLFQNTLLEKLNFFFINEKFGKNTNLIMI